jgi:hypothetical protein
VKTNRNKNGWKEIQLRGVTMWQNIYSEIFVERKNDSNLVKSATRKWVVQSIITFIVNNCGDNGLGFTLESTRPAASTLGDITRNYTRLSCSCVGQGSRNGTSYFNTCPTNLMLLLVTRTNFSEQCTFSRAGSRVIDTPQTHCQASHLDMMTQKVVTSQELQRATRHLMT